MTTKKMMKAEQKKVATKIQELLKEVYTKIEEAMNLADSSGEDFRFNLGYGMGGTYRPNPARIHEWAGDPEDYECVNYDPDIGTASHYYEYADDNNTGMWYSSSMSCH